MHESPPIIRPATQADSEVVVRIYIVSWNAGFGVCCPETTGRLLKS